MWVVMVQTFQAWAMLCDSAKELHAELQAQVDRPWQATYSPEQGKKAAPNGSQDHFQTHWSSPSVTWQLEPWLGFWTGAGKFWFLCLFAVGCICHQLGSPNCHQSGLTISSIDLYLRYIISTDSFLYKSLGGSFQWMPWFSGQVPLAWRPAQLILVDLHSMWSNSTLPLWCLIISFGPLKFRISICVLTVLIVFGTSTNTAMPKPGPIVPGQQIQARSLAISQWSTTAGLSQLHIGSVCIGDKRKL